MTLMKILPLLLLLFLQACASNDVGIRPGHGDRTYVIPKAAVLLNSDVSIEALDGSWKIEPGIPFVPDTEYVSSSDMSPSVVLPRPDLGWGLVIPGVESNSSRMLYLYDDQLVSIKKSGYSKPFYGILAFYSVRSNAETLAQRSWRIDIPDEYFQAALNGGVSFVYQPYKYKSYSYLQKSIFGALGGWYSDYTKPPKITTMDDNASWGLWISDMPFEISD
jgi:hypothetical protein